MPASITPPALHVWKFRRVGGLDQVILESAEDLLALGELDQKLWVALSCPVKGLEIDEKTLALIDSDGDGRILVPELLAAVRWAIARLKNPRDLLRGGGALPLDAINTGTPEGRALLSSAQEILAQVKTPGGASISIEEGSETATLISKSPLNGDGVITPEVATDPATRSLIEDMLATVGGVPDRGGGLGVDAKKADIFFTSLAAYNAWASKGTADDLTPLGPRTDEGYSALKVVRAKIDDYFARCRLAAFDSRALWAVNRQESEYLAIAAKDLSITAAEIAGFPLARVEAEKPLLLTGAVNPAWAAALESFRAMVVAPIYGEDRGTLTEAEWTALTARFVAYEKWLKDKDGAIVEKLGPTRAAALLAGPERAGLEALMAADAALAGVDRLARYYRDLRTLLHNFVNFADFYSRDRMAAFQAGVLYIDSRASELCIRVDDPAAHAVLAVMSRAYIVYLDARRPGETMKLAACLTQGDSDYLFVGRNGIFYDRRGRDWHVVITKILDNPISVRQAFWSPYKKVLRLIEEQVAKRAAAADPKSLADYDAATATTLGTAAAAPGAPAPAVPKRIDVGTVAAIGVAVGAISGAIVTVATKVVEVPPMRVAVGVVILMLVISLPSVIIAWLKLRQRNVGPILEANGWAVNGRVKINIPFGAVLTEHARLPKNSKRSLLDPYEDKAAARRRRWTWGIVIFVLVLLAFAKIFGFWPFPSHDRDEDTPEMADDATVEK